MKKWKKAVLNHDVSIFDALKNLEKSGFQIVLVVDKKNKFLGTLTDGDIRNGIIKGVNLNSKIVSLVNKKPIILNENSSYEEALVLMNKKKVNHIPIIKNKKIIGIYTRANFQKYFVFENKNIFLIMAGGRGLRLKPLTNKTPKPLLKYKNKKLIEHTILKAKKAGFNNIFISVNYLKDKIISFLGNGKKYNLNINYIEEVKKLGTAGSLAYLRNKTNLPIVITNCDIISSINFSQLLDFHKNQKSDLTVVIKEFESQNPFGEIKIKKKRIINIIEKPISLSYINAGIYVINPNLLKYIPKNKLFDMNLLIALLNKKNKNVMPYPITSKWMDVSDILRKQN